MCKIRIVKSLLAGIALLLLVSLLNSCASNNGGKTITPNLSQGRWPEPLTAQNKKIGPATNQSFTIGKVKYLCSFTPFELIATPLDIVTFQANNALFWVGNLLQGRSIQQNLNSFAEIPIEATKRAPFVISIDLLTKGNIQKVAAPSQSAVNNAVGTLIEAAAKAGLVSGSTISFQVTKNHSNQQAALNLGLAQENFSEQAKDSLNVSPQANEITLTAYVVQKAFTVSVDFEGRSDNNAFINSNFTESDLQELENNGVVGENNPPTYVSSITYGRILIFSVTSGEGLLESTIRNLESTITGGSLSEEQKLLLAKSKIKVFGVGGPANAIFSTIQNGDLSTYFQIDAPLTSMVPIAFEIKTVNGNTPALVSRTVKYDLRECSINSPPQIDATKFQITTDKLKVSLRASVTDSDGNNDLKEVIVNWGDNTSSKVQTGFENISQEHTYAKGGTYKVLLQVIDKAGNTVSQSKEVIAEQWYKPQVAATWHWQLGGNINTNYDVDVYIIDLFDNSAALIKQLSDRGRKVICQFSVGRYSPSTPDAKSFTSADLGNAIPNSSGKLWLNINSENVKKAMQARLDLAAEKNCAGVQLDNIDSYRRNTGFTISLAEQITYNDFLAKQAHKHGLGVGFTNDIDQATKQVNSFDFVVNEQCHEFSECQKLTDFISLGKPVFNAEYLQSYKDNPSLVCPAALASKFSTLILSDNLDDSYRFSCSEDDIPKIKIGERVKITLERVVVHDACDSLITGSNGEVYGKMYINGSEVWNLNERSTADGTSITINKFRTKDYLLGKTDKIRISGFLTDADVGDDDKIGIWNLSLAPFSYGVKSSYSKPDCDSTLHYRIEKIADLFES